MKIDKESLAKAFAEALEDLPISDDEWRVLQQQELDSDSHRLLFEAIQVNFMVAVGPFLSPNWNERCEMPNNEEDVNIRKTKKCTNCDRFFCKKHNLEKCPICGHSLGRPF